MFHWRNRSTIGVLDPTQDDSKPYKILLKNGVEKYKGNTERSVAIVGAGMAGLVAGWLLHDAGLRVRIFEASERVGGRVRTLRDGFTSGLYAEAGAMRIPKKHVLTLHLCEAFNLELIDFEPSSENAWVFVNQRWFRRKDYDEGRFHFGDPYTKGRTAGMILDDCLRSVTPLYRKPDERSQLGEISLGEYLRSFVGNGKKKNPVTDRPIGKTRIKPADIDLIGFEEGTSSLDGSLLEAIRDRETIEQGKKFQILGGMDLLPRYFIGYRRPQTKPGCVHIDMRDLIKFHARVTEVKREGKQFLLSYQNYNTNAGGQERADFVVLATPFSALTHVRLSSVLNDDKLHAIRSLHYDNATKIVLEFSERFWETFPRPILGGKSFTDLPIRWTHYPAREQHWDHQNRGVLLASYTWGDDSLRWGSLRAEDRIRFALRDVTELHKPDLAGDEKRLEKLLVSGRSHSWAEDDYAFGAFAIFDPHQEKDLFRNIWTSHEGIHFAGEHTSLKHAWIEGAVESGIRVAHEVMSALGEKG